MISPRIRSGALLLAWAALGCAGGAGKPLYDGPPRPLEEVAVLHAERGNVKLRVQTIDGRKVGGNAWQLLPGAHTLEIGMARKQSLVNVYYVLNAYCAGAFEARAGARYVVQGSYTYDRASNQASFGAWVADAASGERTGRIDCTWS